jgi:hypothetical protein
VTLKHLIVHSLHRERKCKGIDFPLCLHVLTQWILTIFYTNITPSEAIPNSYLLISSIGSCSVADTWICEVVALVQWLPKCNQRKYINHSYNKLLSSQEPTSDPVLNHVNPVYIITPYSFKIHFNIFFPSILSLPSGLFLLLFLNETLFGD